MTPPARQTQRRLTPDQLAELVAEYQAGAGMHKLAERWGVHRTTVAGTCYGLASSDDGRA